MYLDQVKEKYSDIFEGLGKFLHEPYHINLDPKVPLKRVPCRTVPIQQQEKFTCLLAKMQHACVIYLSIKLLLGYPAMSLFKVQTKMWQKDAHLPVSTPFNKAVICEKYYSHTPDDIYCKLSIAKSFTVTDFKKGFWYAELDEELSYLTTFNTPFGHSTFTQLPFGITVSGNAFRCKLAAISRDLLVWGDKDDFSDHDEALDKFFQITRENNLHLGFENIQYQKYIDFFGDTYSNKGHWPTNDRIKAISDMEQPKNVKELQSFTGMCNFLSKYSAQLTELSDDLQHLACKGVHFNWGPEHTESFNAIKKELTLPPFLSYYDQNKTLVLHKDASTNGLWAVLLQDKKTCILCIKGFTTMPNKICSH